MPEGAPGDAAKFAIAGENAQQSWMSQTQERQIRAQQADQAAQTSQRAQQQFQTLLPALTAKAVADKANSENQLAAVTAEQLARGQYSSLIASAPNELFDAHNFEAHPDWLEPDGTPDWNRQAQELEKLQAKYLPLGMFPEGKPYLDAINNAVAKAHQMALTQYTLQGATKRAEIMANSRVDVASTNAGSRTDVATIGAGARTEAATIGAGARAGAAETAAGATENAAAIRAYSSEAASLEKAAAVELDPQLKETLQQKAQIYRDKADALVTQGAPAKPTPKATVTKPAEPPVKVKDWDEAKALKPGTRYVGPDGKVYIRGAHP